MKRISSQYNAIRAWRLFQAAFNAVLIELNNRGRTHSQRKRPAKGRKWKLPDGRINGITESHLIRSIRYAIAPHTLNLLVIDIDTLPWLDKKAFRAQSDYECQCQLKEYIEEDLLARYAALKAKLVHMSWSESGKGAYLYFWQPDPELRTGRSFERYGDCFNGDNFIIPPDPYDLMRSLQLKDGREPLTADEVRFLAPLGYADRFEKDVLKAVRKNPRTTSLPSAMQIYESVKDGVIDRRLVIETVKQACGDYWNRRMSLNPDYDWTCREIAERFSRIPLSVFDHWGSWIVTGMALHDLDPDSKILFQVWDSLSALSENYGRTREHWNTFRSKPGGKSINMGRICRLASYVDNEIPISRHSPQADHSAVDSWIQSHCEPDPGSWSSTTSLYTRFQLEHPSNEIGIKGFSARLSKHGFKDKRKGKLKIYGFCVRTKGDTNDK